MITILFTALSVIVALIVIRLLPLLVTVMVAVWLWHHVLWLVALVVAACVL